MTAPLSQTDLDKLLKGIEIPPCPAILGQLSALIDSPTASMTAIAALVGRDVALSAAVIKVANSPWFALRQKVATVAQAVGVLGMTAVANLVTGELLRQSLSEGKTVRMDRFWDSTAKIAAVAARLSRQLTGLSADQAYTFGLFRDCGIPVLMRRFPDYRETLQRANASLEQNFTDIEDARHATNHAVIGYLLTRNWGLPDTLCRAVQSHHDPQVFSSTADNDTAKLRSLIVIGILADYLVSSFQHLKEDVQWLRWRDTILTHLNLSDSDLFDLQEEIHQDLDANLI